MAKSITLAGGNNITLSTGVNAATISAANQTVQTQNMVAISASDALFSSGTVVLTGLGAAIVNTAAGSIRISVPAQSVQAETQTFVGGIGNSQTTYTSGTVNLSVVAGNLTIRSTTGNAFQFSASQSVQAETQTFVGGIAMNAATTYTSGTVVLSAGNNITLGSNAQTITISGVAAQTVQTQNLVAISASNALFSSGTVTMSGFGDVTVNTAAGIIRISAPVQTAQTGISGVQVSNTTYTSGTVTFQNANGISFGSSGANGISASYTVPTQTNQTGGIYVTAQSTGQSSSSTYDLRTLSFVPDGIISAGWSGGSFRVSATQSLQTQSRFNLTLAGNSTSAGAGYIQISSGVMTLAGGNNITLSQNGNAVTISAPSGGAGYAAGMSNLGNTAGTSGTVADRLVIVGSDNITLSQSVNAGSATISIIGEAGGAGVTRSFYEPYDDREYFAGQVGQGTLILNPDFPPTHQFDRVLLPVIWSNATNSSGSQTLSAWVGLYTRNVSTLSLWGSASSSTNFTGSGTVGSYSLYSGVRHFSIPWATTVTEGRYWIGVLSRSTSGGANASISNIILSNQNSIFAGQLGVAHNTSMQFVLGQGILSVTTAGMPNAIPFTDIRGSDIGNQRQPIIMFASSTV